MPDFSNMPEVFASTLDLAAEVSGEAKLGRLRKIGSRLYEGGKHGKCWQPVFYNS